MEVDCIAYKDTNYFSKLICDYLESKDTVKPFYNYEPSFNGLEEAIKNRKFESNQRKLLVDQLENQYQQANIDPQNFDKVLEHLQLLKKDQAYTVCTGHQLSLFTGPLYFIYKICSVIQTCKELSKKHPDQHFIPIFWMASEDHDWEEINHFQFMGERLTWETEQKGPVGRMHLDGMDEVFKALEENLVDYSSHAEGIKKLFKETYLKQNNLSNATRFLVHSLFKDYGLLILDGDDVQLKKSFSPILKEELLHQVSSEKVENQSESLASAYSLQVHARDINLFYLKDGFRERITLNENGHYKVLDTDIKFSKEQILEELEQYPERFSPNVILRPVYQEFVLPNLAYIGGGGELAYWLQLKSTFDHFQIDFPVILLRNSILFLSEKSSKAVEELQLTKRDLFKEDGTLLKEWTIKNSKEDLLLSEEKKNIHSNLESLSQKVLSIDQGLEDHLAAIHKKWEKSLDQLSDKLIRAERIKNNKAKELIKALKTESFPNGGLQERTDNFTLLYMWYGDKFIDIILDHIAMPSEDFRIIRV